MGTPLNGFISLHRKILNWGWYDDVNTKVVFIHLLLTANFKDTEWHGMKVKRGEVVTSRRSLAEDLKISERSVRTALEHLKKTHEVTIKTYSKFSIISIRNYDLYQTCDPVSTSNRPATDQQPTSNRPQRNNDNNDNNGNNVVVSEDCKKVFELFNRICSSLEKITNPTDLNVRKVTELLQQQPDFNFYDFFAKVENSDFLTGRNGRWNIGGTKVTFDWILKLENVKKIQSGMYDDSGKDVDFVNGRNSSFSDEDIEFFKTLGTTL